MRCQFEYFKTNEREDENVSRTNYRNKKLLDTILFCRITRSDNRECIEENLTQNIKPKQKKLPIRELFLCTGGETPLDVARDKLLVSPSLNQD